MRSSDWFKGVRPGNTVLGMSEGRYMERGRKVLRRNAVARTVSERGGSG